MSQEKLSALAGVSRRMLAAIETERRNVSLATLDRIATAMQMTFAELLRVSQAEPSAAGLVAWQGRSKHSRARLLQSSRASKNVELWLWSLAVGERYQAEPDRPGMSEQVFVISGALTLKTAGETYRLKSGDSVKFNSDRPYEYRNSGTNSLRFIKNVVE